MRRLETPQYQFALQDEALLRDLFDRAWRAPLGNSHDAQAGLHRGVCALVRRAKIEGRQVEAVIVALKDIFGVPDRPRRSLGGDEDSPPQLLLAQRAIRWCIEEYYGQERAD